MRMPSGAELAGSSDVAQVPWAMKWREPSLNSMFLQLVLVTTVIYTAARA